MISKKINTESDNAIYQVSVGSLEDILFYCKNAQFFVESGWPTHGPINPGRVGSLSYSSLLYCESRLTVPKGFLDFLNDIDSLAYDNIQVASV